MVVVAGDGVEPTVDFGACGIPDCKNWAWKNLCAEFRATPIRIGLVAGDLRVSASLRVIVNQAPFIRNRKFP